MVTSKTHSKEEPQQLACRHAHTDQSHPGLISIGFGDFYSKRLLIETIMVP